jgi:hypothetical protein
MEDSQNPVQESQVQPETQSQGVSFPTVGQPKKSGGAKTLLVVGILVLVAILGFIIFKNASSQNEEAATPTPFAETPTEAPASPTPSGTPSAADKSKVKIEVQNGTGITGEAAYLQTQLKALGYTNVTVGNAPTQDATATTVTFAKTLSASIVTELTSKLKELYKEVTVKTSTTSTMDVVIITGLRKGATSKPSSTPTASGTPKPSATASASASASPSASPTATP